MHNGLPHLPGRVKKDSRYLQTLKDRTEDKNHPRHQGVIMQAHHAISEKGVSLTPHGDRLEDFGYDINVAQNLVFIPCTLQGACLLQVQPHRGNHTAVGSPDDDGDHEPSYHDMVMERINSVMRVLESECGKPGVNIKEVTQDAIDKISAKIIRQIQHEPKKAKLTAVWSYYQPGDSRGCRGVDSVRAPQEKIGSTCPVDRNHTLKNGNNQKPQNITFKLETPYQLKPGN